MVEECVKSIIIPGIIVIIEKSQIKQVVGGERKTPPKLKNMERSIEEIIDKWLTKEANYVIENIESETRKIYKDIITTDLIMTSSINFLVY